MTITVHQLLSTPVVTKAISRVKTPNDRLQRFFGMQPEGPAVSQHNGKVFQYDVQNGERSLPSGRAPGTGPARRAPQKIGQVTAAAYRAYENVLLLYEKLHMIRAVGAGYGSIDPRGVNYVTRQERRLAQIFRNNREFLIAAMMRGSFQVRVDGDNWIPCFSGGHFTFEFRVPSGNKAQLNMLGGGDLIPVSWATVASADIPGNALKINAAFEQLHGRPLRHAILNSTTFRYVLDNAEMQSLAGTANRVFTQFTPVTMTNPEGIKETGLQAVMAGIPWLTWHIMDNGLDVDGTFTKLIPDNIVSFLPDPDPDIQELYEGSEMIQEDYGRPVQEAFGLAGYTQQVLQPPGFELNALDVCMPILYVPAAMTWATVVF